MQATDGDCLRRRGEIKEAGQRLILSLGAAKDEI